jgi:tripartite-type tricarboxylate transporter receptor subunit TctC
MACLAGVCKMASQTKKRAQGRRKCCGCARSRLHPARHRHKPHRETVKVLQSPEFQGKLAGFGADPMLMHPGEFDAYVRNEIAANEALVKAAGLAPK